MAVAFLGPRFLGAAEASVGVVVVATGAGAGTVSTGVSSVAVFLTRRFFMGVAVVAVAGVAVAEFIGKLGVGAIHRHGQGKSIFETRRPMPSRIGPT